MIGFNWLKRNRLTGLLVVLLILGSCARITKQTPPKAVKTTTATGTTEKAPVSPAQKEALTPSLLYGILLGEIAGQRGRMDVSAPSYLEAAKHSQDPRIAERALKISVFGKQPVLAQELLGDTGAYLSVLATLFDIGQSDVVQ